MQFGILEASFREFLSKLSSSYQNNPYHNFTHAFDVAQAMFVLLTTMNVRRFLRPVDVFAVMVASLCHDCGHPGLTNAYLIATKSPLGVDCIDQSVLEHHHCSVAFELLRRTEPSLLANLSADDRASFNAELEASILATDMAKHNALTEEIATNWKSVCVNDDELTIDNSDLNQRKLLIICLLKFCDISNVFRVNSLSTEWMMRITDEYFAQGDQMRALNMEVPDVMNRNHDRPREETTRLFIVHVVAPFFDRCVAPLLSPEHAQMLRSNLMHNEKTLKKKSSSRNRSASRGRARAVAISPNK